MLSDCLKHCISAVALLLLGSQTVSAQTSVPASSYIFPAGGQRGQTVDFMVGGLFLLDDPWFEMLGTGVDSAARLHTGKTVWFEGPMLTGQRAREPDEYPRDHQGIVSIAADAPAGIRPWRVWTSQGATAARVFVIGEFPEVVEQEIDGDPVPQHVTLPVTVNGRVFPRSDLDIWTFEAKRGEIYTIELSAKSLLSPLDARIALFTDGQEIADDIGTHSRDPVIQFEAQYDGRHQVHVHDVGYAGGQAFVYRLTLRHGRRTTWIYPYGGRRAASTQFEIGLRPVDLQGEPQTTFMTLDLSADERNFLRLPLSIDGRTTEPVRLEISDLPERLEVEPNDVPTEAMPLTAPVVLNGRIDSPGDIDVWPVVAQAGRTLELRLTAGRHGSPLQPDLAVVDTDGTILAPTPEQPIRENTSSADRSIMFEPAQDGICMVRVQDRFPSRGGPDFGYRLQVGSAAPGFRLEFDSDALTTVRGSQGSLPVRVERFGGLTGPIQISVSGVPSDTELGGLLIPADKDEISVTFKPSATAPIGGHRIQLRGTHTNGDDSVTCVATRTLTAADAPVDSVLFSVAVATPFKFRNRGPYYARAHAGTVYRHPFTVERGEYNGPITVRVADRQRRHLQGVRDVGEFVIPAGVDDFEFPFFLPPWMSRDRLGRCLVMGIGELVDEKGNRHQVAYTDGEQAQAPINVKAGRLSIFGKQTSLYVQSESVSEIAFELQRDANLKLPATVELIVPEHIRGLDAPAITLMSESRRGALPVHVSRHAGPFNMPLTLRATVMENGDPVVAECPLTFVGAPFRD